MCTQTSPMNGGCFYAKVEFNETGFRVVGNNTDINEAGQNYIYAAWSAQEIYGYVVEDADTTTNTMTVDVIGMHQIKVKLGAKR